jgi:long-chain acyl-CoA synthetase
MNDRRQATPDAHAITLPGRNENWSFAALSEATEQLAGHFTNIGLAPHSRVALALPNGIGFVVALLAISQIKGIVVPIPPDALRNEAEAILEDSGASLVIAEANNQQTFSDLQPTQATIQSNTGYTFDLWLAQRDGRTAEPELADVVMLKYTSGSTGIPKGVMLTASQIGQEGQNAVDTLELTQQDVILAGAALFHSYGFDFCLMPMLLTGARLVLFEKNVPTRWLRALREENVTVFPSVPRMLQLLTRVKQSEKTEPLRELRYCISATAPLSARTARRFYERFDTVICQNYGSSEAGAITLEIRRKPEVPSTCLGHALQHVVLEIRDDAGTLLPHGKEGEVWVGGGQIAKGYYRDPALTEQYFQHDRCLTGDIGYLDQEGHLFLTGRKKHFINSGGKKISPREIESVLEQHPDIIEVAVVGVEDESLGELVKACIVSEQELTPAALIAHCQQHLASHKIPQKWQMLDSLPRTPAGKVDKARLKG